MMTSIDIENNLSIAPLLGAGGATILKIATAGSVDDGKSTLIGRLLYETNSITKDKIEALETASKRKGLDFTDLSLLTDGLIAEREQGITIDVAHIYFNTPTRKYIIADTPGHIEYTRNMVTGASNAAVSMILIDARNGVIEQTKRHFYIASLLRVPHVIVCVNKMDLVEYNESRFLEIQADFQEIIDKIEYNGTIDFIPLSSLYGENITTKSTQMDWYKGEALLPILENLENHIPQSATQNPQSRFPVQWVIRPKTTEFHDFRGFAGRIASGSFAVGDTITALPTGESSTIASITKFEETWQHAEAGDSVVITLNDEIDVSRGCMLVKGEADGLMRKEVQAQICWLDSQVLTAGKTYLLQHGINRIKAKVQQLENLTDVKTLEVSESPDKMKLNEIGLIRLKLAAPIFADAYNENPKNGAFILIDEFSNGTVGVGFVR